MIVSTYPLLKTVSRLIPPMTSQVLVQILLMDMFNAEFDTFWGFSRRQIFTLTDTIAFGYISVYHCGWVTFAVSSFTCYICI